MKSVLAAVALVAPSLVSAIAFTDPAANATVTKGTKYDLTWTSVDTDPNTFSIYLVNFVNWPPSYEPVALNVKTAAGEASVYVPCSAANSYGYQFNAINGTNVYVIYAQTPKFIIKGSDCTDPAPTTASATCAAATVTVTVSHNASGANGNSSMPVPISAPPKVIGGECPKIIGWGPSGYSQPVVLPQVPVSPGSNPPTASAYASAGMKAAATSAPWGVTTIYSTTYVDMAEATPCNC